MLSARAYTFRLQSRLAISLSWIAGYTNIIALFVGGHTVSHMTGNVTDIGGGIVAGRWRQVAYFSFILVMFLIGAILSAFLTEGGKRRGWMSRFSVPMAVEAILLAILGVELYRNHQLDPSDWLHTYSIGGIGAMAMGLQNATITKISGAIVRTTHVTGVITDIGLEGVQLFLWWLDRTRWRRWSRTGKLLRVSQRHPTMLRVLLLASILGSFLFGVTAAAWVYHHWPQYTMIPPVLFLLWIVLVDWRTPITAVREIDLLSDPELQSYGLVKAMLPSEMGIYRLWCHRSNRQHSAPNFQHWVDILPSHWRVIILALSPLTRLDANAAIDFKTAVQRLRDDGKRIVVAGITRNQFEVLNEQNLTGLLAPDDFSPDLEFAVARGMAILAESGRNGIRRH